MSSARLLESQTSDEDNEDIERRPHQSHSRSCSNNTTPTHPPHPMVRKGGVARRICLIGGALFLLLVALCYLTLSGDTRLGGSEDSEEGSHHGLGKQRISVMESRPADWLLRYTRPDKHEGDDRNPGEEEFPGNLSHRAQEIYEYEWNFKIEEQTSKQMQIRKRHRFDPRIRESCLYSKVPSHGGQMQLAALFHDCWPKVNWPLCHHFHFSFWPTANQSLVHPTFCGGL